MTPQELKVVARMFEHEIKHVLCCAHQKDRVLTYNTLLYLVLHMENAIESATKKAKEEIDEAESNRDSINICHDLAMNQMLLGYSYQDVTKIDVSLHPDWDAFQWFDYLQKQSKEKPYTLEDILKDSVVIDFTKNEDTL